MILENLHVLETWQRMPRMVGDLLGAHPLLQPIRDASVRVEVQATPRLIWAAAGEIMVQIDSSDWWAARMETTEDRVIFLAGRMALQLRRAWDAKSPHPL